MKLGIEKTAMIRVRAARQKERRDTLCRGEYNGRDGEVIT
jgi:hypothetical protein